MSTQPQHTDHPPTPPTAPARMLDGNAHQLNDADLTKLAKLARLRLESDERPEMLKRLAAILDHARSLEHLDLDAIPPLSHPHEEHARLDSDEPRDPLPRDTLADMAPACDGRFIKVPKVLGSE